MRESEYDCIILFITEKVYFNSVHSEHTYLVTKVQHNLVMRNLGQNTTRGVKICVSFVKLLVTYSPPPPPHSFASFPSIFRNVFIAGTIHVCILCLVYQQGENLGEAECSSNIINFSLFSKEDVIHVSFFSQNCNTIFSFKCQNIKFSERTDALIQ